jgi:hypothetical protein
MKKLLIIILLLSGCAGHVYKVTSEPSNAKVYVSIEGYTKECVTPATVQFANVFKDPVSFTITKKGYVTQTKTLGPSGSNVHFVLEVDSSIWITMTDETKLHNIFLNGSALKDPFSVKFKKVRTKIKTTDISASEKNEVSIISYCGYLNAKSSMGGYTGWQPFFASADIKGGYVIFIAGEDQYINNTFIKGVCKGSGAFD